MYRFLSQSTDLFIPFTLSKLCNSVGISEVSTLLSIERKPPICILSLISSFAFSYIYILKISCKGILSLSILFHLPNLNCWYALANMLCTVQSLKSKFHDFTISKMLSGSLIFLKHSNNILHYSFIIQHLEIFDNPLIHWLLF